MPSQTIGLDHPSPGIGVFQATFSVALHVSGSRGSSATTDVPSGPRNCGQLSDSAAPGACIQVNAPSSASARNPGPIRFLTASPSVAARSRTATGQFTTRPAACQHAPRSPGLNFEIASQLQKR